MYRDKKILIFCIILGSVFFRVKAGESQDAPLTLQEAWQEIDNLKSKLHKAWSEVDIPKTAQKRMDMTLRHLDQSPQAPEKSASADPAQPVGQPPVTDTMQMVRTPLYHNAPQAYNTGYDISPLPLPPYPVRQPYPWNPPVPQPYYTQPRFVDHRHQRPRTQTENRQPKTTAPRSRLGRWRLQQQQEAQEQE